MLRVWDLTTGQERTNLRAHANLVSSVAFSADGKMLAFLHMVRGKVVTSSVYVMGANGQHQREIWRERKDMYSAPFLAWKPK